MDSYSLYSSSLAFDLPDSFVKVLGSEYLFSLSANPLKFVALITSIDVAVGLASK